MISIKHREAAPTPPMGWNSWDCYGASVTEDELLGNAQYMAKHLKQHGWEYIVCDIQWYEPHAQSTVYRDFVPLEMDEYSRLIPAVNRFPSSANGAGFRPIADLIHNLGLKFGIHIMRGIPRQAVHQNTPILNSNVCAREIAQQFSICSWNTDMYGVNAEAQGAAEYYNSLFKLYAEWQVDFVKVDDICDTKFAPNNPYSAWQEIELIRNAINSSGRKMVLSLSPGPATIENAWHLSQNANMWRMTDDLWDNWLALLAMFERCELWSTHVGDGCWPDCDMLPLGKISIRGYEAPRFTRLTHAEQITMMTLWCIFRSPLMMGGEMRENDDWTFSLLTNDEVLRLITHSFGARQLEKSRDIVVWGSKDRNGSQYIALFNISNQKKVVSVDLQSYGFSQISCIKELWEKQTYEVAGGILKKSIELHGSALFQLTQ